MHSSERDTLDYGGRAVPPPAVAVPTAPPPFDPTSFDTVSRVRMLALYLGLGVLFGIVLTKAEVISWFRIQEMFRFQAFHMFGIIGAAVVVAAAGLQLIRRLELRALDGQPIVVPRKTLGKGTRYWAGGTLFGLGWGLVGACPAPLLALVGQGAFVILVPLGSAIAGTWMYGALRRRLPH